MFGSGKLKALESQLVSMKDKLESAVKEKTDMLQRLKSAQEKIESLEKQLAESESEALKKKAQDTIVEYEGLKDLYIQKNKEIDANRESLEEGFAREAATKRHDLENEIKTNREDNEHLVAETVQTFAGSYTYYMNQIRALMDAMSKAAQETGASLFSGDGGDIKERFGAKILEHLHNDSDALKEEAGDILLIGQKEIKAEEPADEAAAEADEAAEETAEAAEETAEAAEEIVEEAAETVEEAAEEIVEDAAETVEEAAETVDEGLEEACESAEDAAEAVEEIAEEAAGTAEEAAAETVEAVEETVKEIADEAAEEAAGFVDDFADDFAHDPEENEA